MISRKVLQQDAEGRAWQQADDLITSASNEGTILNDETILKAVKLAEEYLRRITTPDAAAVANAATTGKVSDTAVSEKEKAMQAKINNLQWENAGPKKKDSCCKPKGKWTRGDKEKCEADPSIPVCPKCKRKHKGKCLLEHDLDAEQAQLDKACKLKGFIGKPKI